MEVYFLFAAEKDSTDFWMLDRGCGVTALGVGTLLGVASTLGAMAAEDFLSGTPLFSRRPNFLVLFIFFLGCSLLLAMESLVVLD